MTPRTIMGLSVLACCVSPFAAVAQSVYAQNATVTANGQTISGQYLPIVTGSGTNYYNFTTTISVDPSGNPVANTVFSPSPMLLFDGLKAGSYYLGGCGATLYGPGIGPGGTTEWTWSAGCDASSATFFVGPVKKNPYAARIKKAGITYTWYNYGISGGGSGDWGANCLLGIAQTGNAVSLVSFSNSTCTQDYPVPQAQATFSP